jgi:hypothetical protein
LRSLSFKLAGFCEIALFSSLNVEEADEEQELDKELELEELLELKELLELRDGFLVLFSVFVFEVESLTFGSPLF